MGIQITDHDALVELIYDGVEGGQGSTDALVKLGAAFDANCGHIFVLDPQGAAVDLTKYGSSDEGVALYHAHYHDKDPRLTVGLANLGAVMTDDDAFPDSSIKRSAIYNELFCMFDVRYSLFVNFRIGKGLMGAKALMRHESLPAFDRQDIAALTRLLPHLRRSLRLRQMLLESQEWGDDLKQALDASPTSCAILDEKGVVLCANSGAERLLAKSDGVRIWRGRLSAERASDSAAIDTMLVRTLRLADPPSTSSRTAAPVQDLPVLKISRREGSPVSLLFLPLRREYSPRNLGNHRARALLILHDPEAALRIEPTLLERLHDLTPTEAQLAAAIASGRTVAEFASARGSSEATARVHLKRVLEKTGTRRQADLVRLILAPGVAHLGAGR